MFNAFHMLLVEQLIELERIYSEVVRMNLSSSSIGNPEFVVIPLIKNETWT